MNSFIKGIIVLILVTVFVFCIHDTLAEAPIKEIVVDECQEKQTIEKQVLCYLERSMVDSKGKEIIYNVLKGETHFRNIQSEILLPNGEREDSHGVCQIHLPSHPQVSIEQTYDIEFCIDFIVKKYNNDQLNLWSVYKKLYENK